VKSRLKELGARNWQIDLLSEALAHCLTEELPLPAPEKPPAE